MPAVVLALGLASIGLFIGTNWIRESLLTDATALVHAASEIRSRLAIAHLWVEEYVSGDEVDLREIAEHLERSEQLVAMMLEGGQVSAGPYPLRPVRDPHQRSLLLRIREGLARFAAISELRREGFPRGEPVGIGSTIDVEFDRVFDALLTDIEESSDLFATQLESAHARSRLLFRIILTVWTLIVVVAVTGLWSRDRGRRRAEEALRRSQAELFQAQKMESLGRLAGGIAHDINNYLAAISAQCEVVRMKPPTAERLDEKMASVLATVRKASELIGRLLALGRRQPTHPEVLSLNRIVEELTPMMTRLLGEDVRLRARLGEDLWNVEADPAEIEQVLVNLLVNAREAMPGGGNVTIETANADFTADYVETHPVAEPGEYVMLTVSDDGVGIPHDLQERLFEPFVTTKEATGGSGLGLSTVYGVVRRHGGRIWLYSEPGEGATFKIYLPRSTGRVEPRAKPAPRPRTALAATGRRALLVEDNDALRESTRELLEGLGFSVVTAANGGDALERFAAAPEGVDLVVTDLVMPGINGRQLAERLRELRPELKVLFISGHTADVIERHGLQRAEVRLLQKPFSARQLDEAVRDVLRG